MLFIHVEATGKLSTLLTLLIVNFKSLNPLAGALNVPKNMINGKYIFLPVTKNKNYYFIFSS